MQVEFEVCKGFTLVRLNGRLTAENSDRLATQFGDWLNRHNPAQCVFDISGLDFIDSSGIGGIVTCLHKARRLDGDIRLAGARGQVAMNLGIARLDSFAKMYPDAGQALAAD